MITRWDRIMAAVIAAAVASGLAWHLVATAEWSVREAALFGPLASFLLWGLLLCVLKEPKHEPALAPLLERHVLTPLGKRLDQRRLEKWREEGREEGQAQERDSIRAKLRAQGYDLDKMLPPEENGDVE